MKLLILSDIHANWPALEAVIEAAGSWDAMAFCGDVVDYGPHPIECLRWVAEHARYRVRGNHDNALAFGVDCHCMGSFREASVATRDWHRTLLAPAISNSSGRCPRSNGSSGAGDISACRTPRPKAISSNTCPRTSGTGASRIWIPTTCSLAIRTSRTCADRRPLVVDPGASARIARERPACYATYDGNGMTLNRVAYDFHRTIAALRESPLPRRVISRLNSALTPQSEEIVLDENNLSS